MCPKHCILLKCSSKGFTNNLNCNWNKYLPKTTIKFITSNQSMQIILDSDICKKQTKLAILTRLSFIFLFLTNYTHTLSFLKLEYFFKKCKLEIKKWIPIFNKMYRNDYVKWTNKRLIFNMNWALLHVQAWLITYWDEYRVQLFCAGHPHNKWTNEMSKSILIFLEMKMNGYT